jgi:hypothetical protein
VGSILAIGSASTYAAPVLDPGSGHYYDVITAPGITWDDALTAALGLPTFMGLQGHLATVTSSAEDAYVGAAVAAASPAEYWLGGYQQNPLTETNPTAGWTWVNSEGTFPGVNGALGFDNSYSNWGGGEPNDAYGPGSEQYLGINHGSPGAFNDEGALGLIGGYVIEYDPHTVPGGGLAGVPDGGITAFMLGFALSGLGLIRRQRAGE